jgi:hypothetical protein
MNNHLHITNKLALATLFSVTFCFGAPGDKITLVPEKKSSETSGSSSSGTISLSREVANISETIKLMIEEPARLGLEAGASYEIPLEKFTHAGLTKVASYITQLHAIKDQSPREKIETLQKLILQNEKTLKERLDLLKAADYLQIKDLLEAVSRLLAQELGSAKNVEKFAKGDKEFIATTNIGGEGSVRVADHILKKMPVLKKELIPQPQLTFSTETETRKLEIIQGMTLRILDKATGTEISNFADVIDLELSSDKKMALVTLFDRTSRLISMTTDITIRNFGNQEFPRFTPDGNNLLVHGDGNVTIMDATTGMQVLRIPNVSLALAGLSPDGQILAVTPNDDDGSGDEFDATRIIEIATGRVIREFDSSHIKFTKDNNKIWVARNVRNEAGQLHETSELVDLKNGKVIKSVAAAHILNISPDGSTIGIIPSHADSAQIFEATTGDLLCSIERCFHNGIHFSPNGKIAQFQTWTDEGRSRYETGCSKIIDVTTGREIYRIKKNFAGLEFSPDSTKAIVFHDPKDNFHDNTDEILELVDLTTGTVEKRFYGVWSDSKPSPDWDKLLIHFKNDTREIWNFAPIIRNVYLPHALTIAALARNHNIEQGTVMEQRWNQLGEERQALLNERFGGTRSNFLSRILHRR